MELVELFDILFLKYINAAGTLCNPQATYLNIFPLLICTHMYRDNFPQKESEFCFALNTFTYVSSTKRDSVVGVTERSERAVKWMAGQPAEARGGGRLGREPPAPPPQPPLLATRSSGPLQSPRASADFSFLRMVFGLLPIWLAVFGLVVSGVGRATFIRCFAGACGSLTCCAVRRLPEGISAPAASPVVRFP